MFIDKLLKQFGSGYQEEILNAARYHEAAAFLREQMSALPDAENPCAKECYQAFLHTDSPAQKQFRILDNQVSPLLQDPDVARDWYDLVPVWFRVNNRIRETLPRLSQIQADCLSKTIITESELTIAPDSHTNPQASTDTEGTSSEVDPTSEPPLQEETTKNQTQLRKQNRSEQLSRLKQSGKRTVTLLSGAAGTGKTFQIEERVRYLTDRLQVLPESILMLAHTPEKAEQLGIKYHIELQIPVSVACISEDDEVFTSDDTAYTHILLDDLQHFHADQVALMAKLAERFPSAGWFCTVDDWQTIHGDYQAIYDFRRIFPQCEEETLTKVHRHSKELAENAALFVMSDPLHMRKAINAKPCDKPGIHIVSYATQTATQTGVNLFPDAIALAKELAGPGSLLLPVHTLQDASIISQWFQRPIIPCTPDKLQGAEADGVIIPPSFFIRMRCPILPASVSDTDTEHIPVPQPLRLPARERRLLYSALTRSRGCSIILTPLEYQSAFVQELQRLPVKVHILT